MNPQPRDDAPVDSEPELGPAGNPHFRDVVQARLDRRQVLKGGAGALALAGLVQLPGCRSSPSSRRPATSLGFAAVPKSIADAVAVPDGYTARVLWATGDPIDAATSAFAGDGSETGYDRRAGDHHDGMVFFGLDSSGSRRDEDGSTRALLATNHEAITGTAQYLHPDGGTNLAGGGPRPAAEVQKEMEAHGASIVAIENGRGGWRIDPTSRCNRRITARTPMTFSGPVAGSDLVATRYSPDGTRCRGTLNNCASGRTPWGTYLTAEENWALYFRRDPEDAARRPSQQDAQLRRYGIADGDGSLHRRWASAAAGDPADLEFARWDVSVRGARPADDFRNEPNTFGYIVELDPYDPAAMPKKRTAMGRRANEGATHSIPREGRPLAFYIGCDSRGEYVYKFVTAAAWDPKDAMPGGMATGDKYLDRGTVYAARFDADGTGRWLPLTRKADGSELPAAALAEACVHTRLAADAAGATRMDRPEWTAVNPANGEIYVTMTENPDRRATPGAKDGYPEVDAANPRSWFDTKASGQPGAPPRPQFGNVNGHIVRIREDGDDAAAPTFRWDVFLFGAQAKADAGLDDAIWQQHVNLSGLTDDNDLSKPDGCWFSPATGILWIETDDNTYTDVTNCMLLACLPGRQGDGGPRDVVNRIGGGPNDGAEKRMPTHAGVPMTAATLRRFLVGPRGAEITGLTESPDGRALFVNIQHPGENTGFAPGTVRIAPHARNGPFESNWPGNAGYGPGGAAARPRSATIVITKNDGGPIGS